MAALDEVFLAAATAAEPPTLGDTLPDAAAGPVAMFEDKETKEILSQAINQIGDREKTVLTLYYYEGLTLAEIGEILGVTESRVCQIHTKAVLQLRAGWPTGPRRADRGPGRRPRRRGAGGAHRERAPATRLSAGPAAPAGARARVERAAGVYTHGGARHPARQSQQYRSAPGHVHGRPFAGAQRRGRTTDGRSSRMAVVTMKQLLEAGVHFGHQTRRWNPKMRRFILGERNGIYIIDLHQTLEGIEESYGYVRDLVAGGGIVLFVGTKKQTQGPVATYAEACGMPYVNERWLGGMLTNFKTISSRVEQDAGVRGHAAGRRLRRHAEEGRPCATPRELEKLQRNLGGIRGLDRLPDAIFVIDTKKEHIAVTEANKLGMPVVAVVDTNCDPDVITYVIPGNDDAIRSGALLCRVMADAVVEGRFIAEQQPAVAPAGRRTGRGSSDRRRRHRRRRSTPPQRAPSSARGAAAAAPRRTDAAPSRPPPDAAGAAPPARPPTRGGRRRPGRRRAAPEPAPAASRRAAAAEAADRAPPTDGPTEEAERARFTAKDVQRLRQLPASGCWTPSAPSRRTTATWTRPMHVAARARAWPAQAKRADREASEGAVAIGRVGDGVAAIVAAALARPTSWPSRPSSSPWSTDLAAARGRRGRGGASRSATDAIDELKTDAQGEHLDRARSSASRPPATAARRHLPPPAGRPRRERGARGPAGGTRRAGPRRRRPHRLRPADLHRAGTTCPRPRWPPSGQPWRAIARNEGKPEAALAKIVEGRLNGWFKERVLLDQPYVQDEKQTIAHLLGPAPMTAQFAQVVVRRLRTAGCA